MPLIINLKLSLFSQCLSVVRPDEGLILDLKFIFFILSLATSSFNSFYKIYFNHVMPSFFVLASLAFPSIFNFSIVRKI